MFQTEEKGLKEKSSGTILPQGNRPNDKRPKNQLARAFRRKHLDLSNDNENNEHMKRLFLKGQANSKTIQ